MFHNEIAHLNWIVELKYRNGYIKGYIARNSHDIRADCLWILAHEIVRVAATVHLDLAYRDVLETLDKDNIRAMGRLGQGFVQRGALLSSDGGQGTGASNDAHIGSGLCVAPGIGPLPVQLNFMESMFDGSHTVPASFKKLENLNEEGCFSRS
jgi:hypothetical protein